MQLTTVGLDQRHYGISPPLAATLAEAASVCLGRFHSSPQDFVILDGQESSPATVSWLEADARARAAWNNETDATETGACALAVAAVEATKKLVVVSRAETLTGADYYLDHPGKAVSDFEMSYRLEVSGVSSGEDKNVKSRLKVKVQQARNGKSSVPAMACVVGFQAKYIAIEDVQ